jgi:hypothetical protein
MLPFLKKTKDASVSLPADTIKREPDEGSEEYDSLEAAAEDLYHAIQKKDFKAIAAAWRAGSELIDSEPHSEGPHTNEMGE